MIPHFSIQLWEGKEEGSSFGFFFKKKYETLSYCRSAQNLALHFEESIRRFGQMLTEYTHFSESSHSLHAFRSSFPIYRMSIVLQSVRIERKSTCIARASLNLVLSFCPNICFLISD